MLGITFSQANKFAQASDEPTGQHTQTNHSQASQSGATIAGKVSAEVPGTSENIANMERSRFSGNLTRNALTSIPEEIETPPGSPTIALQTRPNKFQINPIPATIATTGFASSAVIREGVHSNDGLNSMHTSSAAHDSGAFEVVDLQDPGMAMAFSSSLTGTLGADIFAILDTFVTVQAAISDSKNKTAARQFTQDHDHIAAYDERKNILTAYELAEKDPDASAPSETLTIDDVKYVIEFEELQSVAKGDKPLKKMARFRDAGLQPVSGLWNTGMFIANAAADSAIPAGLAAVAPGLGLVSGTINVIGGTNEVIDAQSNYKKSTAILMARRPLVAGTSREQTLMTDLIKRNAENTRKNSSEALAHGASRAVSGTSGVVTASLSIAALAASASTLGVAAGITAATVGGAYALGHTRKVYKANAMQKELVRGKEIALTVIEKNKRSIQLPIYSLRAFHSNKDAYFLLEKNDKIDIKIPSSTWYGKQKYDKDGIIRWSKKPVMGSDVIDNRHIREYLLAGSIAEFLMENPNPLCSDQTPRIAETGAESGIHLGRQYIEDLKGSGNSEKVDILISKARSVSTFSERMEILNMGIHALSSVA